MIQIATSVYRTLRRLPLPIRILASKPLWMSALDATTDIHVYVIVRHKPTWSGLTGWEH
jgi:hypothetical protein